MTIQAEAQSSEAPASPAQRQVAQTWERLQAHAKNIVAAEPRAVEVLWPLFQYVRADVRFFDMVNMCLLAGDDDRELLLNQRIIDDVVAALTSDGNPSLGIDWFWVHQMVHVYQGLSYRSFRELNKDSDRMETMRADSWADFISIKVLALLHLLDEGGVALASNRDRLRRKILEIHQQAVRPMLNMDPNIFIPFARDIEIKRILSLMAYRLLSERVHRALPDVMLDDSIFVNWRENPDVLYIWYGQTNLVGRRSVPLRPGALATLTGFVRERRCPEAYELLEQVALPDPADYLDLLTRKYSWA